MGMNKTTINVNFNVEAMRVAMQITRAFVSERLPEDEGGIFYRDTLKKGQNQAMAFQIVLKGMDGSSDQSVLEKIKTEVNDFLEFCKNELKKVDGK